MDATRRVFLTTAVTAAGAAATRNLAHPDDHEHDHSHEAAPLEDTLISTRLTERFGIRHPIVCAPMAYIAGGALAAAVSRGGGLGIVAGGFAGTISGEPDLETELIERNQRNLALDSSPGPWRMRQRCWRNRWNTRRPAFSSPLATLVRLHQRSAMPAPR